MLATLVVLRRALVITLSSVDGVERLKVVRSSGKTWRPISQKRRETKRKKSLA